MCVYVYWGSPTIREFSIGLVLLNSGGKCRIPYYPLKRGANDPEQ